MKAVILFFVLSIPIFGQIDTTVFYPLQKGNYWEYYGGGVQKGVTVLGDTTISGKQYWIIKTIDFSEPEHGSIKYRRLENNVFVYDLYGDSEILFYDFSKTDSSSWAINDNYCFRGFVKEEIYWSDIFSENLLRKEYENQYTDENGNPIYIEREWEQVSRGVGETLVGYWGGYIELVGAIIDRKEYGKITSITDKKISILSYQLESNFPNPFNPSTQISYTLVKSGFVVLQVYNSLGEKISTLVSKHQKAGNYLVEFNAKNLSSGVYYYKIAVNGFHQTKKMLLLR